MTPGTARAVYAMAYVVALVASVAIGRSFAAMAGIGVSGSSMAFLLVSLGAGLAVCAGYFVENPFLWARLPGYASQAPKWVGESRSTLLSGTAPAPGTLGLALGMFSALMF